MMETIVRQDSHELGLTREQAYAVYTQCVSTAEAADAAKYGVNITVRQFRSNIEANVREFIAFLAHIGQCEVELHAIYADIYNGGWQNFTREVCRVDSAVQAVNAVNQFLQRREYQLPLDNPYHEAGRRPSIWTYQWEVQYRISPEGRKHVFLGTALVHGTSGFAQKYDVWIRQG